MDQQQQPLLIRGAENESNGVEVRGLGEDQDQDQDQDQDAAAEQSGVHEDLPRTSSTHGSAARESSLPDPFDSQK